MEWIVKTEAELSGGEVMSEQRGKQFEGSARLFGADPEFPIRLYAAGEEEYHYLGLMEPQGDTAFLHFCAPPFSKLLFSIGRIGERHRIVAVAEPPRSAEPTEEDERGMQENWERRTEFLQETEEERFLFSHPATRACVGCYGHFAVLRREGETLFAFPSPFGPHPLPHLARESRWCDLDLGFGNKGYFLIGLRGETFFLPEDFA